MVALLLLLAFLLILLNAFFVLAEFAVIKVRPTKIEELVDQGDPRARVVQHIQTHLDEYLSVCQVGITFASIALGFVGEPAFARLVEPVLTMAGLGRPEVVHGVAISIAYVLVSFLHILLGELIPKSLAIRSAVRASLFTAIPLRFFHVLFYIPLIVLNGSANALLRMMRIPSAPHLDQHSEEELRILLSRSQERGMMSFRRLLLMENVFDLGDLKVRDAMKPRRQVKTLDAAAVWDQHWKTIVESRFSRYPLMDGERPLGIVHVKDLVFEGTERMPKVDLRKLARAFATTTEDTPIETLLAELQRKRAHLALVNDKEGRWTGFITLEDIIEEIIGTVEDEFEVEPALRLGEALAADRIVLGVKAESIAGAVEAIFAQLPAGSLQLPVERVRQAVLQREAAMSTYLGRGLAIPHARLEGIEKPVAILGRSEEGVRIKDREERAHLFFILLTPASAPHIQARLLAKIAGIMESEFVEARLLEAETRQQVHEAILAGEASALG
ncbi:MAG: DUF21 domain-containing protein [Planctomycetes bacterium]|nr:DUF21 domain-containing protein [Planctomycetota bacterium]